MDPRALDSKAQISKCSCASILRTEKGSILPGQCGSRMDMGVLISYFHILLDRLDLQGTGYGIEEQLKSTGETKLVFWCRLLDYSRKAGGLGKAERD